jgi:hypothetical protein
MLAVGLWTSSVNGGTTTSSTAAANSDSFQTATLEGQLSQSTLQYKFNQADSRANGQDTISVIFEVPADGWVGWGVSDNGGFMPGSEAVIGLPDTGEVLKYNMADRSLNGVQPMSSDKQTLIDTSITQANGKTTLSFTKILTESGEIPINMAGGTVFLGAWGFSNTLNVHTAKGSFTLSGQVVETRKQSLWKAHGWLAAIAWALLCPLAVASSILRRFLPGESLWFQAHRALNMLVVVFTIASFSIAVAAINQETPAGADPDHFNNTDSDGHRRVGLVIFIIAILQAIGGIVRPHLPPKAAASKSPDEEHAGDPDSTSPEAKSLQRVGWEIFHRSLGLSILGLCLYQVQLGIKIYGDIFKSGDTGALLPAFWAVAGTLLAVIVGGYLLRLVPPQN